MHELADAQLLRAYAQQGDQAAFRELVTRYSDLVYSAALRQVNSPDPARDIAQSVFTDLAHKARALADKLPTDGSLAGWLHRSTRFAVLNLLRDVRRRRENERQAMEQLRTNSEPEPEWDGIRPVLDEALDSLDDEDRDALLLRFFKNHDFRTIGAALGVSDDTAQKRVSRALDRLRAEFNRRGVTTSAVALTAALSANAVAAGPAGLAATLSSAALTSSTLAATATKAIAMTTLQKTLIAVAIVGSVSTSMLIQHHSQARAKEADQLLQQQTRQITELQANNKELSSLAAIAGLPSVNNSAELQKLREEAARLRQETNGLAALTKDRWELQYSLNKARQDSQDSNVQPSVWSEEAKAKANYCRQLVQALEDYAEKHQNQFPTSFDQAAAFMPKRTGKDARFTPNQFEIVYQGLTTALAKYANPGLIFLIREKQPWKNTDGKWAKIYATRAGVDIVSVADGNFDALEKQHILPPESSKP